jgi:hypothetical protein
VIDVSDWAMHSRLYARWVSGNGYFAALPGVQSRNLGVLRLENISDCKLVERR